MAVPSRLSSSDTVRAMTTPAMIELQEMRFSSGAVAVAVVAA